MRDDDDDGYLWRVSYRSELLDVFSEFFVQSLTNQKLQPYIEPFEERLYLLLEALENEDNDFLDLCPLVAEYKSECVWLPKIIALAPPGFSPKPKRS